MDQSPHQSEGHSALAALRVVELSDFDAGAACAEILAWYGADVIKIESSDSVRVATTEKPGVDSYRFILLNANKRSAKFDRESGHGKEQLTALIANADVVVENLAPGSAQRLGVAYEAVRALNPKIIYASITGFAAGNPRAHYLCNDMIAQAVGGAVAGTGYVGGQPLKPGSTIGDTASALHCVMGVLAALYQRRITGKGQKVEVAMQEAVINVSRTTYQGPLMKGRALPRIGNTSKAAAAPYNLYQCQPGGPNDYVFISISKAAHKHWEALLRVMGREDLITDARFSSTKARMEHRADVDELVSAWCKQYTKMQAMEAIQAAGATAGAVLDTRELSADPQLRGMFATVNHPVRGPITMLGWPVRMSDSNVPVRSSPALGAHTEDVLSEWSAAKQEKLCTQSRRHHGEGALAGLRVVDLTQYEAGPSCTEALAWLGADVVKIEEPERGERGRYSGTDQPGVDAHYFVLLNANKRSLTCNLKSENGKKILRQLIENADVLVENMAPGAIERLGFGYEAAKQINPGIIFAQIKGFAADGARAKYLCFDTIAHAAGGSIANTGVEGRPPIRPGPNLGDTGAGLHTVTGILAALCQRQVTGRGQRVQMAMQESVINFSRMDFASTLASGTPPQRRSDRDLYRCQGDGDSDFCFVDVSSLDAEQWKRFAQTIGKPQWADDSRLANRKERDGRRSEIDAAVSAWCSERRKIEVMDIFQKAGIPAGAVLDTQELIDDPDLRISGMFATIEHPVRGAITIPAWPVRMSDSRVPVKATPLLGAHTEEVLAEWVGLSKAEIQELTAMPAAEQVSPS